MSNRLVTRTAAASLALLLASPAFAADTLNVGTAAQTLTFSPLDAGIADGAFAKEGLDVHKLGFSGAAKLNEGMIAGAVEVGLTGSTDFSFQVKGTPAETVGAIVDRATDLGLSVGNGIQSAAQLKGKRIGVTQSGTLTYWLAQEFARHQGWGDNGITTIPVGGHVSGQVAAIISGEVSGVMSDTVIGWTLQAQHRGRLLVTAEDFVPGFPLTSIVAADKLIKDRPDVVRRFLAAWYSTVDYLSTHEQAGVAAGVTATGLSAALMKRDWESERHAWSKTGRLTPHQLDLIATAITQIGLVSSKPDLTKYYDPQFLPNRPGQEAAAGH